LGAVFGGQGWYGHTPPAGLCAPAGEHRVRNLVIESGDERLLRIALDNLIGNAWKFTSKTPHPRIEFGVTRQNDRTIYFVRDNGVGFNMAHAKKLFTAFQRLHDQSEYPGSGIGLSTIQRIIGMG